MKGQWIIKEVYFEDGFPKIIRDLKPETPDTDFTDEQEILERFADLVAAHERERLADKFMEMHNAQKNRNNYFAFAARVIREEV